LRVFGAPRAVSMSARNWRTSSTAISSTELFRALLTKGSRWQGRRDNCAGYCAGDCVRRRRVPAGTVEPTDRAACGRRSNAESNLLSRSGRAPNEQQHRNRQLPASITVESRDAAVSLQLTVPLNRKPTEAKPPQTSSERGKQLPSASGYDASCLTSASAVLQNHPGALPSWTLRAPRHEGTLCWHAAARPSAGDHRRKTMPTDREIVGTTENTLFPPPMP
jgi:hypothetical protein